MALNKVADKLPWLLALLLVQPVGAAVEDIRYVNATTLNVRAQPSVGAPVQARLKINQAVTLRNNNGRWCEITASALERPGYTDCQYLARQALTLAAIETETADLILELNRLAARSRHDLPSESVDWGWAYEKSPVEFQRIFEQLFQQFEKHFALSPSLRTYVDYERLLAGLTWLPAHSLKPMPGKLEALYKARAEQLRAMRKALTADFSSGSTPLVRRAITATLGEVLEARQAARYTEQSRLSQKAERSFFHDERWAVGWAGGPLVGRFKMPLGQGVGYRIKFDGNSAASLADVFEMAKVHRAAVSTTFQREDSSGDLSRMQTGWDGKFEFVTLATALPVWGVTDKGLVRGQLRKVSYGGGSCSDGSEATNAELVFPEPVAGTLHAAFISSVPIDPAQARVTLKRRTWLEPLYSDETTFSHRIQAEIDLDGDGVADLRTTIKEDHSVSQRNFPQLAGASGSAWRGWYLRPVAGWYEQNIYQLEVNENGRWHSLSLYNLVTCT